MVSPSLGEIGLVGIELACMPSDGEPLGMKVDFGEPLGMEGDFSSIASNQSTVLSLLVLLAPLDVGNGVGLLEGVELGGNMPFLWSRA